MYENTAARLYPLPGSDLPLEDLYLDLSPPSCSSLEPGLPYVAINMVSSMDGKVSIGGTANDIGGAADRVVMRNLRSGFDAVLRGAGTLRAEKISTAVPDSLAALRASRGLPKQPYEMILTRTGNLPISENLLGANPERTLVIVPEHALDDAVITDLDSRATLVLAEAEPDGSVNIAETLRQLKDAYCVDRILVEGGPSLNHALISAYLVEGLFLTLSPKLLGGAPEQTLLSGNFLPKIPEREPKLRSVYLAGGELFLRYVLGDELTGAR
jgi:2,5-diamino-6-(ribosylamino)-4(3H)-pyrimidinone 5'-phosphate reductase